MFFTLLWIFFVSNFIAEMKLIFYFLSLDVALGKSEGSLAFLPLLKEIHL